MRQYTPYKLTHALRLKPGCAADWCCSFSVCLWEVGDHPLSLLSLAGVAVPLQTITVTPSATDGRQVVITGKQQQDTDRSLDMCTALCAHHSAAVGGYQTAMSAQFLMLSMLASNAT